VSTGEASSDRGPAASESALRREKVRRRATRIVLLLLVAGVVAAVFLLQGNQSQSTVVLGIFAGCAIALYLIEVWARTGRIR
jgi:hypothetical protein